MATPAEKAAQLRAFNDSLLDNDPEMVDAEGATKERLEVNRPPQQAIDQESIIMRRRRPVLAAEGPDVRATGFAGAHDQVAAAVAVHVPAAHINAAAEALPPFWEGTSPPSGVSS